MSPVRLLGLLAASAVSIGVMMACSSDSNTIPSSGKGGASAQGGGGGSSGDDAGWAGSAGAEANLELPLSCVATTKVACIPMTNEGCTESGASCDYAADSREFTCFPSGNTEAEGAACDNANGPWCAPTLHCVMLGDGDGGVGMAFCARWCCSSEECTAPHTCVPYVVADEVQPYGMLGTCH